MSTSELKSEIQKALDNVPETILKDVLAFLKHAQQQPNDHDALVDRLRKIMAEDKNLLDRLAK